MQQAQPVITWTLLALGAGFLIANTKLLFEYIQFVKRRRAALLTWQPPKPPYYGMKSSCADTGRCSSRAGRSQTWS